MGLFSSGKRAPKPPKRPRAHGVIVSAVIPAAGVGSRMGHTDKLRADVLGKPLLLHTLLAFQRHEAISEIIIAAREEELLPLAALCRSEGLHKVAKVVKGGASRAESVLLALLECHPKSVLAAIHDGARPCVSERVIGETVRLALRTGAAAPGLRPVDTLKSIAPGGRTILSTLERDQTAQIQTPQCFYPNLIKAALTKALTEGRQPTDDCAAVEAMGVQVWLTDGEPDNFKVTFPGDVERAEWILRRRTESAAPREGAYDTAADRTGV